jgi:hypothetical protein
MYIVCVICVVYKFDQACIRIGPLNKLCIKQEVKIKHFFSEWYNGHPYAKLTWMHQVFFLISTSLVLEYFIISVMSSLGV